MYSGLSHVGVFSFLKIFLASCTLSFLKNGFRNDIYAGGNYSQKLQPFEGLSYIEEKPFLKTNDNNNTILLKLYKQDILSKNITTYYGQVVIGENSENKINVLYDTGSTEFWIPFENYKGPNFNNTHNIYKRTKSFKYKYDKKGLPSRLEVNYLSGKIIGFDGYDTVKLGRDLSVSHTNIAFATDIDIPLLEEFKWDGIVGLGFENEDSRKRGIKPFLDHLKDDRILTDRKLKNMFGYYINDTGGFITLGGIDNQFKRTPEEEIIWSPVSTEMGFWTIDILGIRKETIPYMNERNEDNVIVKYEGFHDGGSKSIVDTGTFLIYAPKKTMDGYLKDLVLTSCEDKNKLPYIIFQLKGKKMKTLQSFTVIEIVLSPNDYVIEYIDQVKLTRECILGIQVDEKNEEDYINGWTLGQTFLKAYYTIFDKDNLQVGFVRSRKATHNRNNSHEMKTYVNIQEITERNNSRGKSGKGSISYNGPLGQTGNEK
ncbi:aspartyl protease, putative [Plasmodium ovale]|uniref:Aspartyl protease, putative n=1 Tax=Plasmodium ovale TaxID=36330 RepID=A0A1D3TG85_PLAOA|nr:aspartyl protease, putative [Plasmodium ovale]